MDPKTNVEEEGFFPADYQAPSDSSSFMNFADGDNTFRILSKPVMGFEYWTADNKPVRQRDNWTEIPTDSKLDKKGKPTAPKHFWNFLVYNYKDECLQTLEIKQVSVMKAIKTLIENPKWGSPLKYDLTVNKTGKDLLTKYAVVPNPHSEISAEIKKELDATTISPEDIFE
jgi:hypothetical protein